MCANFPAEVAPVAAPTPAAGRCWTCPTGAVPHRHSSFKHKPGAVLKKTQEPSGLILTCRRSVYLEERSEDQEGPQRGDGAQRLHDHRGSSTLFYPLSDFIPQTSPKLQQTNFPELLTGEQPLHQSGEVVPLC